MQVSIRPPGDASCLATAEPCPLQRLAIQRPAIQHCPRSCVHHFDDADVTELLDPADLVAAMVTAFTDLGSGLAGAPDECGDLIHAVDRGIVGWGDVVDLADVLAGRVHVERAGASGPIVFETQGVAIQDVAAAALVWRAAVASLAHDVATIARRRPVRA